MRAGGQNETDPAAQTAQSGVDRHLESRFYPLYAGWLGTTFMRACFLAQRLFVQTELGNGLVVVARRK
jgi:hypothetical protein